MDFVEGLGDTSAALEMPIDDIGRVEIRNGRVRITLVTYRAGTGCAAHATVCLVWTVEAWKSARKKQARLHDLICGNITDPDIAMAPPDMLHH